MFRGFGAEQVEFLVQHEKSMLKTQDIFHDGVIDLNGLEKHKKDLNKSLLLADGPILGIYEELILACSMLQNLSDLYDGTVVLIDNNLFGNFVPSCLEYADVSAFFDYMQAEQPKEDGQMEQIGRFYSDAKILGQHKALLCPINVHKDQRIQVREFFAGTSSEPASQSLNNESDLDELTIGHDSDFLYRLSILQGKVKSVCIRKDIRESDRFYTLAAALNCLQIPYRTVSSDLKASAFSYDASQFLPYLKRYWGENAGFRELDFYKDPDTSKEIETISQGALVSEIIEQCEMANDGEESRDVFITAPTGAGKSLLFQLPAIYISEKYKLVTIVISPLIALMNDQVAQLEMERGVTCATCINSSLTFEERQKRIEAIRSGEKSIVYLAPELLLATGLQTLLGERKLGLFVIDEVHTVTSWGRDFRADYWFLGDFLRSSKKKGYYFPTLCLTATAVYSGVDDVVNDTVRELDLEDPVIHLGNVKRKNIGFDIVRKYKKDYPEKLDAVKTELLLERVRRYTEEGEKTIAYCPYASQVDMAYHELPAEEQRVIRRYHGQLPKAEKNITEMEYRSGEIKALICTKAFGMGMDRSDIKHIVHFAPTGNLSDYVQEIGRAARDPKIHGTAHMDFFREDMRYVQILYSLSEMKQFQLKAMLRKVSDIYEFHKHRNMLIAPDSFRHLFSDKELEAKVKNGLLMLAKDLRNKYGFPVLIIKPRAMLTRIFVSVPDSLTEKYMKAFGAYSTVKGKIPSKYRFNSKGERQKISYPGTVYALDIGEVWERKYSELSFGAFKKQLYDPSFMEDGNGNHIVPRIQINIVYHKEYEKVKEEVEALVDIIIEILKGHKNAPQKTFEEREFITEFKEAWKGEALNQNQIRLILDMLTIEVNENGNSPRGGSRILQKRKQQKNQSEVEYIIRDSYYLFRNQIRNWLSDCYPNAQDGKEYHSYIPFNKDRMIELQPLLTLMEILELASYDLKGGEKAEIFLRVNDPVKLKNIAYAKDYSNVVLKEIVRRHKDSMELLRRFFTTPMTNEDRWNFIENYFLGR